MMSLTFFNLFANATFSLWTGLLIVYLFIGLFRIPTGTWKLFLLLTPFVKVIFDFAKGIPETSVLEKNIDPMSVEPGLRFLTLGAGWNDFGPVLQLVFSIKDASKHQLSASAGDFLYFWLSKKLGQWGITAAVAIVTGISLFFILRRLIEVIKFESLRRKDRRRAEEQSSLRVDWRTVDVYLSDDFIGTPFTGGIFKPYICIPQKTYKMLSSEELRAVIAHELGHIRQFDVIFTIFVQVLGDVFWFIPGYRWLSRKIDRTREIIADQYAVRRGVSGEFLASALVKLKEVSEKGNKFILYSAFTREKSLLKLRIEKLLGNVTEHKERLGWKYLVVRVIITFWICGAVMNSTLAGNHKTTISAPEGWMKTIVDYFGIKSYSNLD